MVSKITSENSSSVAGLPEAALMWPDRRSWCPSAEVCRRHPLPRLSEHMSWISF